MNKLYTLRLLSAFLFLNCFGAYAQTTIYSENFNGATNTFTLNTTDNGGLAFGDLNNNWLLNDNYLGFGVTLEAQPASITGSPASAFLHINNSIASATTGPLAIGPAFSPGLVAGNHFAKMTSDINTTNYNSVSLNFYYATTEGTNKVYYSINGGTSWVLLETLTLQPSVATWTSKTISNAAFNGKATLRFAFEFNDTTMTTNGLSLIPFCIDEVTVKGNVLAVDSFDANAFIYYPNPVVDKINLAYSEEMTSASVFNVLGQEVIARSIQATTAQIDMTGLASGTYFIKVTALSGTKTIKVIK